MQAPLSLAYSGCYSRRAHVCKCVLGLVSQTGGSSMYKYNNVIMLSKLLSSLTTKVTLCFLHPIVGLLARHTDS
jgi:hypothetical protein